MSELQALKNVYTRISKDLDAARDSFYDADNEKFHLMISAECLTLAECKTIIADEIINQLEINQVNNNQKE